MKKTQQKHMWTDTMWIRWLVITAGVLYLFTIHGVWGNPGQQNFKYDLDAPTKPLELSPERGRFILTYALAHRGSFSLDQQLADAAYPDVGFYQGRFYIFFAPGLSVLALPFYWLGYLFGLSLVSTFFFVTLITLSNLVLLFIICRTVFHLPAPYAVLAPLCFGFASTSWPYSGTLYQHNVSAFLIILSFFAGWLYRSHTHWKYPLIVFTSYAIGIAIDYPNAVYMLPSVLALLIIALKKRHLYTPWFLASSILFFLIMGLHGLYNYRELGSVVRLNGSLLSYKTVIHNSLLENPNWQQVTERLQEKKHPLQLFDMARLANGIVVLLFSFDRGLLFYSPLFLFGYFALFRVWRVLGYEKWVFVATMILNTVVYASFNDPWGGWAYGPRYLIISLAILSLPLAVFLSHELQKKWVFLTFSLLFSYSAAVTLLGVLTTNAVPTPWDAQTLGSISNYSYVFFFFWKNQSISFLYGVFFSWMPLWLYYCLLLSGVLGAFAFVLKKQRSH